MLLGSVYAEVTWKIVAPDPGFETELKFGLSKRLSISNRTSTFMVHDEKNEAKPGDTVAITETRPMSRRKRWALKGVVRQAVEV